MPGLYPNRKIDRFSSDSFYEARCSNFLPDRLARSFRPAAEGEENYSGQNPIEDKHLISDSETKSLNVKEDRRRGKTKADANST